MVSFLTEAPGSMPENAGGKTFLAGRYRVLDLTEEKGVYCGRLLADLGADVIKVEPPAGDALRYQGSFLHDEPHLEKSLRFLFCNANKRGITLNIQQEAGRALLLRLVKDSHALVESFSPGYLESLGLGYDVLKRTNPALVVTSITPFGQDGPYRDYKSSDIVSAALSHWMQVSGEPDGPPARWGGGDQTYRPACEFGALGTLMALFHSAASGVGQRLDISILESAIPFTQDLVPWQVWHFEKMNVERKGSFFRRLVPGGVLQCKNGWIALACIHAKEWKILADWVAEATGDPELTSPMYAGEYFARAAYYDLIHHLLTDFTMRFTKGELFHEGQRRGIVVLPVNNVQDLANCPQLRERGAFQEVERQETGPLTYPKLPFYWDGRAVEIRRPAPLLGQHNRDIYCDQLGYSQDDLVVLRSAGTI